MTIDPNIIKVSACGKYVYPVDSISGAKTFAPIEYFKKNVEVNYGGSVERFVREYKTRETKKYLKEGFTPAEIRAIADKNNGKLPKIVPTVKISKVEIESTGTNKVVVDEEGTKAVVKVFPWTGDPSNYFKSAPAVPLDVAEVTKESCLRPATYLDNDCVGCPYYDVCQCHLKCKIKAKK